MKNLFVGYKSGCGRLVNCFRFLRYEDLFLVDVNFSRFIVVFINFGCRGIGIVR